MIIVCLNSAAFAAHRDNQYAQVKTAYPGGALYFVPDGTQWAAVYDDEGAEVSPVRTEAEIQAIGTAVTDTEVLTRITGLTVAEIQTVLGIVP